MKPEELDTNIAPLAETDDGVTQLARGDGGGDELVALPSPIPDEVIAAPIADDVEAATTSPIPQVAAEVSGEGVVALSAPEREASIAAAEPELAPLIKLRDPLGGLLPLLGGIVGVGLCWWGETIVEAHDTTPLSMYLFFLGIAIFTVSGWLLAAARYDVPALPVRRVARKPRWWLPWAGLGVGLAVTGVLYAIAYNILYNDTKAALGGWLWLASMVALVLTSLLLIKPFGWRPRWGLNVLPQTGWGKLALLGAIIGVMVIAVLARFLEIDGLPFGITPDEGDQAATSAMVLNGSLNEGLFGVGWYHIPMMYFYMLAGFFKLLGTSVAVGRSFSAICGVISVAVTLIIGVRHFGWRVGLIAGAILAMLAVELEFSRLINVAAQTETLWAISGLLFLEAARSGKLWAWVGAGLSGGFSVYFYPTGRLWVLMGAGYCLYLLIHGLGGRRGAILRGSILAGAAAVMIVTPFLLDAKNRPGILTLRAVETSVFTSGNDQRLHYYFPGMTTVQLIQEQLVHAVGGFNQFPGRGLWLIQQPMMSGWLAIFTLLGLGWIFLRWRDPRYVLLAAWFAAGFVGVVVTNDTPDLLRLVTTLPVVALAPALVLESLIRRVGESSKLINLRLRPPAYAAATAAALMLVALMMLQQRQFFFEDTRAANAYPRPYADGAAILAQGKDTLVIALGRQFHLINAGWMHLLAPDSHHGGMAQPGSNLPLTLPATSDVSFIVEPEQPYYLPFLESLYPGGTAKAYTDNTGGVIFTMYHIPQVVWAATQGAMAIPPNGAAVQVDRIGQAPPGWSNYPNPMRWSAGWRVPRYWNYALRVGPGPATLSIDGQTVLTVPLGSAMMTTTLSLARGDHYLSYDGNLVAAGQNATFDWAELPILQPGQALPELNWQPIERESLIATQSGPRGLYGVVQIGGRQVQHVIVSTLANGSQSGDFHADGNSYTTTWSGTLNVTTPGDYQMSIFAANQIELQIDGQTVITQSTNADGAFFNTPVPVTLSAGAHTVLCTSHVTEGQGGLEWMWTPPGGSPSIVPPDALAPPPGVTVGPVVDAATLGIRDFQPVPVPLIIAP